MTLRFFNTLTKEKEEFVPLRGKVVRIYSCGPTTYDFAHIGNIRAYTFADILRRNLGFKGFDVIQIMNLTDVDDKTIKRSQQEKVSLKELVEIIKKLLEQGIAYKGADSSIYYNIKKFPTYGKLAHIDLKNLKAGARVKQDEYTKDELQDFALWKAWDKADGNVFWETEIGKGRPGWHIECSAMSTKYLGHT